MADILPFRPADEYYAARVEQKTDDSPLTPKELHASLVELMFEEMHCLIVKLKATGKWNSTADKHVRAAIADLDKACSAMAGLNVEKSRIILQPLTIPEQIPEQPDPLKA